MSRQRRRWVLLLAAATLIAAALACGYTDKVIEVSPYELSGPHPPHWICATATPPPTSLPDATATPEPTIPGVATSTPDSVVLPTAYPTPTPHYRYGEFYLHQNVWVGTGDGKLRISLAEASQTYVIPDEFCWVFAFNVRNFSDRALDVPLELMAFLRTDDDDIHTAAPHVLQAYFGDTLPDNLVGPGESREIQVPICHPPEARLDEPAMGLLTDALREGKVGTRGHNQDALGGADSAVYIHFSPDPKCGYSPPDQDLILWPQIQEPPPPPPGAPFSLYNYGGRISTGLPLPPGSYRLVRGFGCAVYPTGVSGAGRCPPERPYWHTGVDLSASEGVPVYHTGVPGLNAHWGWSEAGYGNLVVVQAEAYRFYYAHLSAFGGEDPDCLPGLGHVCQQGSRVGSVGSTGFSSGPHLHFEVRVNDLAVDPYLYFGGSQSRAGGAQSRAGGAQSRAGGIKLARLVQDFVVSGFGGAQSRPQSNEQDAPVDFLVRLPDGSLASGVSVIVLDEESREELARCETWDGRCSIALPPGVYPIEFAGVLPDGREVSPVGAGNVEFMQSGQAEYLYGPLAFYHTRAASIVGVALLDEGRVASGEGQVAGGGGRVAGPYFDADPGALTPVPLVPAEVAQKFTPPPGYSAPPVTPVLPIIARPSPRAPRSSSWMRGLLGAAFLTGCVLLVMGGAWLRRRRERKRRGGQRPAQTEGGAR